MLQKYSVQEQVSLDQGASFLSPAIIFDILKRRFFYFLIPFVLIFAGGTAVVMMIPAVYSAEGKILVESQQIPSDLVKPTVSALANERIQVISQRILTRDNLLQIANKYQLFSGHRKRMTGTEMVDWMRDNTKIKPVDLKTTQIRQNPNSTTLAFTVGFEHEVPATALRVASEFVTMILSEDVRVRTNFASETTKFLEREVRRLETELASVESKMADIKRGQISAPSTANGAGSGDQQLTMLRAELMTKAAIYSDSHPEMKAIKQKIAALEKLMGKKEEKTAQAEADGLEGLERRQAALEKNLEITGQKLTAARLGESLERGQQSERLEVIEQPTLPQKPIRPNRPKFMVLVFALSAMASGGLVFVLEALQNTIYRTTDLLRIADSHLIVPIPYISTEAEVQRRRTKIILIVGGILLAMLIAGVTALFFLPPLDILFNGVLAALGM
jgi:uncharacterized protein involved in exopolysaccharide biosynthesis